MGHLMVQHTFKSNSGLPEDGVVNTFHFARADISVDYAALADEIRAFYEFSGDGVASALITYMATSMMGTPRHSFKMYNMDEPRPRVPVYTGTAEADGMNSNAPCVAEQALCLSYAAEAVSGIDAARRRGRIYISPLTANSGSQPLTTAQYRPVAGLMASMLAAGVKLKAEAESLGYTWSVFSPTQKLAAPGDAALYEIKSFFVDDAFDTVRTRGPAPTARVTATVS